MILIADSGSTKTDWCLIQGTETLQNFTTQGINPFHQSPQEITGILKNEVLPELTTKKAEGANGKMKPEAATEISGNTERLFNLAEKIKEVFFYGAGCTAEKAKTVCDALQQVFPYAHTPEVTSDMLGAARALCGNQPGIACILGTGSNSCYYDGKQIRSNIPPLGYILGDEGSGAALGKRLVGDCLKKQLPEELCKRFLSYCQLTQQEIIDSVYRQPMPNRFLAGLSRFLYANRQEESIHRLLVDCFSDFIRRNLLHYPSAKLFFIGSVAFYYAEELKEAAALYHLPVAAIVQRPMEGLITYHTKR